IYSDAIVYGAGGRIGGLIGLTSSSGGITMKDCWFAGSATINVAASYLGGLVGHVAYASTIENCLNTGEVYHKGSVGTAGTSCFVGYASAAVTLKNCVNHKNPAYTKGSGVGYFIGTNAASSTLENCHSINWYEKKLVGDTDNANYPTCTSHGASTVKGLNAKNVELVSNLFTDESAAGHWICSNDSLPVLTYFAAEYAAGTISD
ncbi:MAG: hypothetical protein IK088_00715, partial [Lachnospiraceae bacterium]|nr:hypothetical protein [Lachnospiraceae bacterium]